MPETGLACPECKCIVEDEPCPFCGGDVVEVEITV